jgi:hypothetical protein
MAEKEGGGIGMSELLTLRDVAEVMKISEDSASRIFARMDGVIDLGQSNGRRRRRYRMLRIPRTVLEAYLSKKAGRTVTINVPRRPERRRKTDGWKHQTILNLAKACVQNECTDRAVIQRIAERARMLLHVPQQYWSASDDWYEDLEEE